MKKVIFDEDDAKIYASMLAKLGANLETLFSSDLDKCLDQVNMKAEYKDLIRKNLQGIIDPNSTKFKLLQIGKIGFGFDIVKGEIKSAKIFEFKLLEDERVDITAGSFKDETLFENNFEENRKKRLEQAGLQDNPNYFKLNPGIV